MEVVFRFGSYYTPVLLLGPHSLLDRVGWVGGGWVGEIENKANSASTFAK